MKKVITLSITILIPVILTVYYFQFYNPASTLNYQCGLYQLTGYLCPGCGGQRAYHHLLHGDIVMAIRQNIIFILGLPFLIYLYYICIRVYIFNNNRYTNSFVFSSAFAYSFLIILAVFFIVRNIPVEPFTYLVPPLQ